MASQYRRQRRVEFADTDAAGIAHFSSFFRYMEETEHEFLRSLGLSVIWSENGVRYGFPRLAARCEFQSPVRFEDVLEIELRVRRVGRSSMTYEFLFTCGGRTVALGALVVACVAHLEDGGIEGRPLPPSFTGRIEECGCEPLAFRGDGARGAETQEGDL